MKQSLFALLHASLLQVAAGPSSWWQHEQYQCSTVFECGKMSMKKVFRALTVFGAFAYKLKFNTISDLHFLVLWLEEEDALYDVVGVREIVLPEGLTPVEIKNGDTCKVSFQGKLFEVQIIAKGTESLLYVDAYVPTCSLMGQMCFSIRFPSLFHVLVLSQFSYHKVSTINVVKKLTLMCSLRACITSF